MNKEKNLIVAYFETNGSAECAGSYQSEEAYMKDLPRLKRIAKEHGFTKITERYI
jgi:hypothetical protein|tara:strand:+ start:839 stop:1003 length:165 start_codon:yes stop_codon:yes gene_type:complete